MANNPTETGPAEGKHRGHWVRLRASDCTRKEDRGLDTVRVMTTPPRGTGRAPGIPVLGSTDCGQQRRHTRRSPGVLRKCTNKNFTSEIIISPYHSVCLVFCRRQLFKQCQRFFSSGGRVRPSVLLRDPTGPPSSLPLTSFSEITQKTPLFTHFVPPVPIPPLKLIPVVRDPISWTGSDRPWTGTSLILTPYGRTSPSLTISSVDPLCPKPT